MSKRDEPAFPQTESGYAYVEDTNDVYTTLYSRGGLSKREYFAGLALQGLCQKYYDFNGVAAKIAVQFADALLLELSKAPNDSCGEGNE